MVLPYATTRLRPPPSSETGLRHVKWLNRVLTSFVLHAQNRSRGSTRPATSLRADAVASTTSRPAFVTTRDRPSYRNGMAVVKSLIWGCGEARDCPSG